jgi:hypothetical protein
MTCKPRLKIHKKIGQNCNVRSTKIKPRENCQLNKSYRSKLREAEQERIKTDNKIFKELLQKVVSPFLNFHRIS